MSCISDLLIQKYVHNEASVGEKLKVDKHITECEACSTKFIQMQNRSKLIKEALDSIVVGEIYVPEFHINTKPVIERSINIRKKVVYSLSAACIVLFLVSFFYKPNNKKENLPYIVNPIEPEINANLPVSEQEMYITVIDPNGNITKHPLK